MLVLLLIKLVLTLKQTNCFGADLVYTSAPNICGWVIFEAIQVIRPKTVGAVLFGDMA
ncbi:hypothetical protein VS_2966 [Vibrio atlanticus]|uniref:Uncharacterized protein n=1 Tax=Vibrio atlanticus (strain LGP32) TaxID=575788 RepID=B7VM72_VIBA3|nr:hypothetical protein VS_2966 [Vibrio atlanticus]